MKWKFWQKKKPVGQELLRRWEIPADRVQEIRRLFDAYQSIPGGADKEAHYPMFRKTPSFRSEI